MIEIPELYQKLDSGDALIGTGIERLDSVQLTEIKIIETDKISAVGLIHIFAGSLNPVSNWVAPLDAAEFEPKYAIEDFNWAKLKRTHFRFNYTSNLTFLIFGR